jgi:glycosyltransferase involved in cell wall biosynthesis
MTKGTQFGFSIIIPTLNEEKRLPKLLDDLAKQTFPNFEIIIVDGKSEEFKNKFQKFTLLQTKQRNVSYQRNLGAKQASAAWLIFIDADCQIPKYFLQGIKFHTESKEADIITTHIIPDTNINKDKALATIFNIYLDLQKNSKKPTILESMLIIQKSSFNELRGFDEKLHWAEGADLLRRAVKKKMDYEIIKEPKYTYSFRRLRSQGTLKSISNSAFLELARLQGQMPRKERVKKLYPMEGGKYFEIDKETNYRIEKFFSKLFANNKNKKIRTPLSKVVNNLFGDKN